MGDTPSLWGGPSLFMDTVPDFLAGPVVRVALQTGPLCWLPVSLM